MTDEAPKAHPMVRSHIAQVLHEENAAALSAVVAGWKVELSDDLRASVVKALDDMAAQIPDEVVLHLATSDEAMIRKAWRAGIERKLRKEFDRATPEIVRTADAMLKLVTGAAFVTRWGTKERPS